MPFKCVIKIGGTDVTTLAPIDYVETFTGVNKIPYAVIRIRDWLASDPKKTLIIDGANFKVGSEVVIEFGDEKATKPIFTGVVARQGLKMDAEQGYCYIEIVAKDKANCLTIANHVLSFKDKTDDDILKAIITTQGLQAEVSGLSVKHESFTQYNMTDWDLINIRAESYGKVVLVDKGKVSIVEPKSAAGTPTVTFGLDIISMDLEINSDNQIEEATGKVWDVKTQKMKDVKGTTAPEKSFGSVAYGEVTKAMNMQKPNFVLSGIKAEDEIKNVITGVINLNRFAKIQGSLMIDGNAAVLPNTCVKIDKGSALFQGNAYVSGVKHILDDGGWSTKVYIGLPAERYMKRINNVFTPDNHGIASSMSGLFIGKVKKLDGDPEKEHRIFVNIPTIHADADGVWCRVASLYASNKFGVMYFPEVDDEVVVGFLDSDPRSAIVVGSLFSSKNAPPETLTAENNIKMIKTKSEMIFKFDEKDKIITVETPGKRSIVISDKAKSIEITNDSDKISMVDGAITMKCSKDITLEGANIMFKAQQKVDIKASGGDFLATGNNLKLKGNMSAALEGGASATLKSSGNTVVKGTLVNIN